MIRVTCPECGGKGRRGEEAVCPRCRGEKRIGVAIIDPATNRQISIYRPYLRSREAARPRWFDGRPEPDGLRPSAVAEVATA